MVTPQKEVCYTLRTWNLGPPERNVLQTLNLALRLVTKLGPGIVIYHPLDGSPPNPRMVTHWKEVYYRLGFRHLDLTHKTRTR